MSAPECVECIDLRMQLRAAEEREKLWRESRQEMAQDIEDLFLVATVDTVDEGGEQIITAYHFKTGALHRLLGKARCANPAFVINDTKRI